MRFGGFLGSVLFVAGFSISWRRTSGDPFDEASDSNERLASERLQWTSGERVTATDVWRVSDGNGRLASEQRQWTSFGEARRRPDGELLSELLGERTASERRSSSTNVVIGQQTS